MNQEELAKRVREVMKNRMKFQKETMRDYDAQVYFPALNKLRGSCSGLDHRKGQYHRNGLGWAWWYCSICGAAFGQHKE